MHAELSGNGYPASFVNSVHKQLSRPPISASSVPAPCKRAAIPYASGTSEALARVLRSFDVHVSHVPVKKLKNVLTNVKDKLPKEKFPGVVYRIPCTDCDHVYIGETGDFQRRLKERCYDVKKEKVSSNALAEHSVSKGHDIDWASAHVLATEINLTSRLHLESLLIQTTDTTLNRNDGTLPSVYARCLRHLFART